MSANCLTFDDCLISGAPIERAMRGLHAPACDASKHLRSLRPVAAQLSRAVLMKHFFRESAEREDPSIARLVASSKDGDSAAMELLIGRYQSRVAGFVFACVGDGQAVDDLCQTIFYKMLVGLRRLEDDGKFEPWLFRIARNACFDYLRRRQLRRIFVPWQSAADQAASAAEPSATSTHDRVDNFRRALMRLPKKQRELVALLQDQRLSYEQLAAITSSSVSSVKARLFRARRQLRRSMRDDR
jgi:RNA polymerase sigma-70 factor, ECF subfamily